MKKSSPYYALKYLVQCKWPHNSFWETICAFNSKSVADSYALKCQTVASLSAGQFTYRVISYQTYRAENIKLEEPNQEP